MICNPSWVNVWFSAMGYRPNPTQVPIVEAVQDGCRIVLISGGERSGKSYTGSAAAGLHLGPILDTDGNFDMSPRLYWIVASGYRSARPEFNYIHDALASIGGVSESSTPRDENSPWSLDTPWGVRIETRTSADTSKLSSFTVHGAIMAEANAQEEEAFRKLRGRISETRGWILLIGTLEESAPWYVDAMRDWEGENEFGAKSFSLPTWSNTDVYPEGFNDPEIQLLKATLPEDYFSFRYAAKPMKSSRLVIPEFDRRIHISKSLSVVDGVPVELAIDPGFHTFAVGFCQVLGQGVNVLDAIYDKNAIVQDIIPKIQGHPLWEYIDPANAGVIDVAAKQRHGNLSVNQVFQKAGIHLRNKKRPIRLSVMSLRGKLKVNEITGQPRLRFSSKLKSGYINQGKTVIATGPLSEFDLWMNSDAGEPSKHNCDFTKALAYLLLDHFGAEVASNSKSGKGKYGSRRKKGWKRT